MATKDNVARVEHEKRVALARAATQRTTAQQLAARLADVKLTLMAQVGEEGKLYGSITSRDIEDALAGKGFEIDRRKILMDPIKELGAHTVPIKIAAGVDAQIAIEVVAKS
jgi:large subunit ribosomal protein L9